MMLFTCEILPENRTSELSYIKLLAKIHNELAIKRVTKSRKLNFYCISRSMHPVKKIEENGVFILECISRTASANLQLERN